MQWKTVTCGALSFILAVLSGHAQTRLAPTSSTTASSDGRNTSHYGNAPLMFEANQGQTDSQVKFLSRDSGYSVFLTSGGLVLALRPSDSPSPTDSSAALIPGRNHSRLSPIRQLERAMKEGKSTVLAIDLVGAAANPVIVGEQALSTKVNYFIGRDPSKWRRNIPTYGKIRYRNVYPGIDLIYYGNNHSLEYDFDVAPGADAAQIQFAVKGADMLNVDASGDLVLTTGTRELRFQTPALYQEVKGVRSRVPGSYVLRDRTHVGFEVGSYDNTKLLVIDPVLVYSTFLGGSSDDFSNGIAVDSSGDAYVVGLTDSPNFPASIGSYNPTQFRMFLTKLDPTGSSLLFADYFGGTSGGDEAYGIALDSSGNAYVAGGATSSDFPVVKAYQSALSGSADAFLTKFSADGSSILYSTYLGGSTSQFANSVSVDPAGEAVIAGVAQSTDFPMVNAYQPSVSADQFGDWGVYGFLTKFASDGMSLVYSTYLAGSALNTSSCVGCFPDSVITSVVTDANGNAYATGYTTTTDFPVTSGTFTTTYPGSNVSDVGFVSKFTSSGGIAYSTYLGGLSSSILNAIAVDTNGQAYVTGFDIAGDSFPIVTTSICDPSAAACNGAIVAKLDPTGTSLLYSTFLGTNNNMAGQAIQVDSNGNAFIVGSDVQFDLSSPIEGYAGNGDIVVAEIDSGATTLLMATFLGGKGWEAAADSLALDQNGAVYVTGVTQSFDFPVTQSALQKAWGGQTDAFVTKIDPATTAPAVTMGPISLQFASQVVGTTSASQTTVLRNMGSASLTISAKTIGSDFGETDDCGASLAAASFCTFTVTFAPSASGPFTEALTITDNGTGSPHVVTLTGTGAAAFQSVTVTPSSLTFPPSSVGAASATQTIAFANGSNAAVLVSGIQLTGSFTLANNNCGTVLPQGTCTVQVGFLPTSSGPLTGTLRFVDSASASPQVVALSGSGIDFVATPVVNEATISPGGTATYKLNITPTGGAYSKPVRFACNGAPAFSTCSVRPISIIPGSSSSAVSVSVTTSGPAVQVGGVPATRGGVLANWLCSPLIVFGVLVLGVNNRRRSPRRIGAAVIVMLLLLVGCGGTGRSPIASNTTPPGTYNLTVVATSGTLQHVTKLTLIVQ
jgi:Beta-propeller repeat/Abnormal spindle-like microcephaly-assoc'd, ASPM-SPD-2-Hydin